MLLVLALIASSSALANCPDYAEGYNRRSFVSFIREDYKAAPKCLDRAVALTPDHIRAIVGRALALMSNPWLPERNRVTPLLSPKKTRPRPTFDL
ncbi:tetratricopeptide repeat protein [Litoreibacter arenae]|uniref:hypothetical protein n=1 Tax=Litoreibacter arenae TaxID=491388 RepID=UPI0012B5BD9A|nr:hypothetical protein [Litoreibacter arenae]